MKKKLVFIFIIIIIVCLVYANSIAKEKVILYTQEYNNIFSALEDLNNEKYLEAEKILGNYVEDDRYKFSATITVNYLVALIELDKTNGIENYLKHSYNANPYLLLDDNFLNVFDEYLIGDYNEN